MNDAGMAETIRTLESELAESDTELAMVEGQRDRALATIERVKALHVIRTPCDCTNCRSSPWCASDKMLWPCPTIKALEQP